MDMPKAERDLSQVALQRDVEQNAKATAEQPFFPAGEMCQLDVAETRFSEQELKPQESLCIYIFKLGPKRYIF